MNVMTSLKLYKFVQEYGTTW